MPTLKKFSLVCLILAFVASTGCHLLPTKAKESGTPSVTAKVEGTATSLQETDRQSTVKEQEVDQKTKARDGKILADANAAQRANTNNPDGVPKAQVDSHLVVLKSRLGDSQEDPEEVAATAERDRLFALGQASEARAATEAAVKEAKTQGAELAQAQAELRTLRQTMSAKIADLTGQIDSLKLELARNKAANQAAIDAALDSARRELNRKIAIALVIGCVLLVAAGAVLGYLRFNTGQPMQALVIAAAFGGGGAFCATLAYLINEPWFQKFLKVSIIGGAVGALIVVAVYLYLEFHRAKAQRELAAKKAQLDNEAGEAENALMKIYDVLDGLPKTDPLFDRLSKSLDLSDKALINELKAIRQRNRAGPSTPS